MTDFDQVTNYTNYIEDDPFRRGLHFPAVEEVLGDLAVFTVTSSCLLNACTGSSPA
jgi:hypothetical protein